MAWKYLLFDLDGTLTDSKEGIIKCVRHALEEMKKPIPPEEELLEMLGPPLRDGFHKVAGLSYEEAGEAVKRYRKRYSVVGLFENKLYNGMEQVLDTLQKRGYLLAVATSKLEEYTIRILEHFGIKKYFTEIVGSMMDGSRNEKADIIREVFARLEITEEQKKEVIMIGDRKYDILSAKECNIAALGVSYGFAQ